MTTTKNLDSTVNEYSYKMIQGLRKAKVSLNTIDKVLGVLNNDGVYGYYVYCKSQTKEKDINERVKSPFFKIFVIDIVKEFKEFFNTQLDEVDNTFEKYDKYFSNLSTNIHELLFFKDILEKILTYARYHAKVYGDENE